ncbi:tctex1 domain-containing protein 1-B-like [Anneissia japonica]|uniref:tctex1 domain-containing protein 1-B-like n=1 Tax=Anneissia japonica TaxID=1529436 RepID=UPI001425685E|nr:tctex1 domain-containing protein 1-B-like [Anneissia japonica]XP_033101023.1 tctex1 domain-containing protein 1-B-like [Anneissia japonica]XP_033101033.1 tctex1 domain-containing protein 1-B-like [Anneissia japonica]XP_033101040.1 tctex1 domain-containing protein 1-B-like [Anneissia japonica]XP_033101048.1 tctex1 domain-containing protein 1-B-like [Anneissia japonica]
MAAKVENPRLEAQSSMITKKKSSFFELTRRNFKPGNSYISMACAPSFENLEEYEHRGEIEVENTYRMDPPKRFVVEHVEPIIQTALEKHLSDISMYDATAIGSLSKTIAGEVNDQVKLLNFERFKLICIVYIGEKRDQDVRLGSRCLWDSQRDTFASASYENTALFASATVYGLYYE